MKLGWDFSYKFVSPGRVHRERMFSVFLFLFCLPPKSKNVRSMSRCVFPSRRDRRTLHYSPGRGARGGGGGGAVTNLDDLENSKIIITHKSPPLIRVFFCCDLRDFRSWRRGGPKKVSGSPPPPPPPPDHQLFGDLRDFEAGGGPKKACRVPLF